MRTRQLTALVILLAITVIFLLKRGGGDTDRQATDFKERQRRETSSPADNQNRREEFDRRIAPVIYTKHARCRMRCRHIDESEVQEILEQGRINHAKSDPSSRPDPKYALEGTTRDNQEVRIIFAPTDRGMVVVTVIDLEKEWSCDCK